MLQTLTPTVDQMSDSWTPQRQEISATATKSILIIEDDNGIRDILGEVLAEETIHQVFLAQDGESCLIPIRVQRDKSLTRYNKVRLPRWNLYHGTQIGINMLPIAAPDLFFVDYRLPDINGLELIDRIRRVKGYEQTPMVLMSASLSRERVNGQYLRYLRKPFDLDNLLKIVEEAIAV